MKKNLFLFTACVIFAGLINSVNAQLFIKGGVGYGAGTQKILLGKSYTISGVENVYASFGGNVGINLGAGYELNEYVDFGVDLNYQHGRTVYVYDNMLGDRTYTGRLIAINPSLTFKTSPYENFTPYARLGVFTGVPTTKMILRSEEKKFRGGIPFGFNGAIGADMNLSDSFKLFAEVNRQSMIYKPKRRREMNGDVVHFKDFLSSGASSDEELSHHFFSFGATSINIGLKIVLQ